MSDKASKYVRLLQINRSTALARKSLLCSNQIKRIKFKIYTCARRPMYAQLRTLHSQYACSCVLCICVNACARTYTHIHKHTLNGITSTKL